MNGMIVPSVSAGSSHRAARETCTPQVMTPSGAAWSGRADASRRNASAVATSLGKAVQPGRVVPNDQELFFLGNSLEVPFDHLPRMRPGRHGVRVVGRPHDVLDPDELAARHSHPIVDEGREDLTAEVLARREL